MACLCPPVTQQSLLVPLLSATMGPKVTTDVNGDEQAKKRERESYTAAFKLELINLCSSGKHSSNSLALAAFNRETGTSITAGTLSKWIRKEEQLRVQANDPGLKHKKHAKQSQLPYVEESMRLWYYQVRRQQPGLALLLLGVAVGC